MKLCNSYIEQDQDAFDQNAVDHIISGSGLLEEPMIEVNPMFLIRRQRSLIDDADDHISY